MQNVGTFPQEVTIGSGALLIADSADGPWSDTIHVKDVKAKIETTEQPFKNCRDGLKKTALNIVTEMVGSGSFICDYPNKKNLLLFLMGSQLHDASQGSGSIGEGSEPTCLAKLGEWVKIGTHRMLSSVVVKCVSTVLSAGSISAGTNGGTAVLGTPTLGASAQVGTYQIEYDTDHFKLTDPDANVVSISKVEGTNVYTSAELGFTKSSGTPQDNDTWTCVVSGTPSTATMTLGTDYKLESKRGLVMVLETNTKGVVDGTVLKITYSYAAHTASRIYAGTQAQYVKHVWFIGDPVRGVQQEIRGKGSFKPSGDLALIGDNAQEFTVEWKFEDDDAYSNSENGLFVYEDHGVRA